MSIWLLYLLGIVARGWDGLCSVHASFAQTLLADKERLCVLQTKDHAGPLGLAGVSPRVHGGALDADIAGVHSVLFARVKLGNDCSLWKELGDGET